MVDLTLMEAPKESSVSPSLTPIVVESRCYFTFEVLAMNSVSYKFLLFRMVHILFSIYRI